MKKLLALVLALVMTLGLATISANAATYSDADDIDYTEAVDVMSAIGVFNGMDGAFNPDGTLTREQGAKIIAYMLLGEKKAEKLTVSNAPFEDVAADRWSAPYIAYCVANKIVDGIGNGKFDPAGQLTGHAFGKMLLTALGIEGEYTGANWSINVATALVKNELDDEVESVTLSSPVSRQEAAQFAFNAVKYNGTEKVYGVDTDGDGAADVTFDDRTDALLYAASNVAYAYVGKVENTENSLLDEVFDVTVANGTDKFGRPAVVYSNNNWDDDLTVADAADYTFTASKAYDNTNAADLSAAINKELNITAASKKLAVVDGDTVKYNNVAQATASLRDFTKGDVVEIYMNGTSKTDVATVIVTRYDLVKVSNITKLSAATIRANASNADEKIVNATSTITLQTPAGGAYTISKNYDTQIPGFAYEKNDFILVAKNGTNDVLATKAAETVSGTITAIQGAKVGISGTYYDVTADATTTINTKGTWALNASGALAGDVDVTDYTEDFIYIYSINKKSTTDDGVAGTSYVAYGVTNEGVKASYTLATVTGTKATETYIDGGKDVAAYKIDDTGSALSTGLHTVAIVTAYSVNKDGELEVASSKLTAQTVNSTNNVSKSSASVGGGNYATDDTTFIFTWVSSGAQKTKVITGYKNVNITASATNYYAVTGSSKATYVFVLGQAAAVNAAEDVVYAVKSGSYVYTKDADSGDQTYTYTFLTADGDKVVEASAANGTVDGYAKGTVFAYEVDSDAKIVVKTYTTVTTVSFVSGSQIQTASGKTIDTSGVDLYTVTLHTDSNTVEVESGASFSKTAGDDGYNVAVCVDADGDVVAVFALNSIAD